MTRPVFSGLTTLIFDLDGVLNDSIEDVADVLQNVLQEAGLPRTDMATIRRHFNYGEANLIRKVVGDIEPNRFQRLVDSFRERLRTEGSLGRKTRLYPEVVETLEHFQDKKLAILTNKDEMVSRSHLRKLGILDRFTLIVGADSTPSLKPDPGGVLYILKSLGCRADQAMMIGDGISDIRAGKQAGTYTCAVASGYTPVDDLRKTEPDLVIYSLGQLKDSIR